MRCRSHLLALLLAHLPFATDAAEGAPAIDQPPMALAGSEDVGDPASFGRNVKWLGLLQTGTLSLRSDCTAPPPGPDDRCVVLAPAPASTSFNESDMGRITLPGRSANSLICQWVTPFINYGWFNGTAAPALARFQASPTLRIESDVLNDPGLVDPNTGLPLAGAIETGLTGTYSERRTLGPSEQESRFINYSRVCIGGVVSDSFLAGYGLSAAQIRRLFRQAITLRVGIRGSVALVDDATVFYGLRLVGD